MNIIMSSKVNTCKPQRKELQPQTHYYGMEITWLVEEGLSHITVSLQLTVKTRLLCCKYSGTLI